MNNNGTLGIIDTLGTLGTLGTLEQGKRDKASSGTTQGCQGCQERQESKGVTLGTLEPERTGTTAKKTLNGSAEQQEKPVYLPTQLDELAVAILARTVREAIGKDLEAADDAISWLCEHGMQWAEQCSFLIDQRTFEEFLTREAQRVFACYLADDITRSLRQFTRAPILYLQTTAPGEKTHAIN